MHMYIPIPIFIYIYLKYTYVLLYILTIHNGKFLNIAFRLINIF